jgi:hypothetical protein
VTEAAGLGPSGHPSIWRPRSLALFFFFFFAGGRGQAGISLCFSHWHLGQGWLGLHLTFPTPEGPRVKNRGIVVTRPALCNCRLPPGG